MKLNITVDIDWIDENGSIDEQVKNEIIHGVKNAISISCLSNMEEKSKEAINKSIAEASKIIQEKAIAFVDNWLENEVTITDKYGDKTQSGTLKDLIKRDFNDILNRKVDADGKFSNGYNSSKYTLIEYLTGKRVEQVVMERMKSIGQDIDSKINEHIKQGIKERVSDKFAQMIIGAAKTDYDNLKALTNTN